MKNVLLKIATAIAILAIAGCADIHVRSFANTCEGVGGSIHVGVLGDGQSHEQCFVNGRVHSVGPPVVQQRQPGEPTARIIGSLEVAAAPIASKGLKHKRMDCNVNESNGQGGYFCNSAIHAESTEVFGQPVAPGGRRDQYQY